MAVLAPALGVVPAAAYQLAVAEQGPSRTTIFAAGELDIAARHDLAQMLRQHHEERGHTIQLDLSKVTFFDCSCLGVLVGSHGRLLALDGALVLSRLSSAVARVVALTGMTDTLVIVPRDPDSSGHVVSSARPTPEGNAAGLPAALSRIP